jgi:hypothetical protein
MAVQPSLFAIGACSFLRCRAGSCACGRKGRGQSCDALLDGREIALHGFGLGKGSLGVFPDRGARCLDLVKLALDALERFLSIGQLDWTSASLLGRVEETDLSWLKEPSFFASFASFALRLDAPALTWEEPEESLLRPPERSEAPCATEAPPAAAWAVPLAACAVPAASWLVPEGKVEAPVDALWAPAFTCARPEESVPAPSASWLVPETAESVPSASWSAPAAS